MPTGINGVGSEKKIQEQNGRHLPKKASTVRKVTRGEQTNDHVDLFLEFFGEMNGPATMYRTAQVIRHDLPVELPDCMYKVRNVHGQSRVADLADRSHVGADITEQVKRFLQVFTPICS